MADQLWLMGESSDGIDAGRLLKWLARRPKEGLVVEYKRELSQSAVETVAAMANTQGGVLLVGVDEDVEGADAAVGVPPGTHLDLVNQCFDRLDPPYVPDIVSVVLAPGREVLVVRINSQAVRRPVVCDGRVRIRLQGRNATADSLRIRTLAAETDSSMLAGPSVDGFNPRMVFAPVDDPEIVCRVAASAALERRSQPPLIGASQQHALTDIVKGSPVDRWLPDFAANVGTPTPGPWRLGDHTRSDVLELRRQIPRKPAANPLAGARIVYTMSRSPFVGGGLLIIVDLLLWPSNVESPKDDAGGLWVRLQDLGNMARTGVQTVTNLINSDATREFLPTTPLYAPSGPACFVTGDLTRVDVALGMGMAHSAPSILKSPSRELFLEPPARWPSDASEADEWIVHGLHRLLLDEGITVDREDVIHHLDW